MNNRVKALRILSVMIAAVVIFETGYFVAKRSKSTTDEVVKEKVVVKTVQLPAEVKKRKVTVDEVESKLNKMAELTTYSCNYTVTHKEESSRYIVKNKIPGTTNSIQITATGVVKVGYDISKIKVKVGDDKIYISIPEVKLNDNYVIWDNMQYVEENTPLNPIEISQYYDIIDEIEKKGLKQAEASGIYSKADENLKNIINGFLSEFVDYEVVYM